MIRRWVLLGCLVASVASAEPVALGDAAIRPKPPAPRLPAAGGSFDDPTYGTKIVRLTDDTNAPEGAAVNSSASDRMFNADGSLCYVLVQNRPTALFAVDRGRSEAHLLGSLPPGNALAWDGAAWDPKDPLRLYAISMSARRRELWEIRLPLPGTLTLLHDFSDDVPPGGYPYSRVQVTPDGRAFAVALSTTGGQDEYDHVVVWNRESGSVVKLATVNRLGVRLHSMMLDGDGDFALLETGGTAQTFLWRWKSDALSRGLGIGAPDWFGGHKVVGRGIVFAGDADAGWSRRSLAAPEAIERVFAVPRRDGKIDWFEDSHSSRLSHDGRRFVQSRYVGAFGWGTFVPHEGRIHRLEGLTRLSAGFAAPEAVRYRGKALERSELVPTRAGEWSYDAATDTLFLWLPDGEDPQRHRGAISIFDWRPLMDEIIRFEASADGTWSWRRIAHHRMHFDGAWYASPRANSDDNGSMILFQSNWDGSPRIDVFLAFPR